jgi:hypothetical protein
MELLFPCSVGRAQRSQIEKEKQWKEVSEVDAYPKGKRGEGGNADEHRLSMWNDFAASISQDTASQASASEGGSAELNANCRGTRQRLFMFQQIIFDEMIFNVPSSYSLSFNFLLCQPCDFH